MHRKISFKFSNNSEHIFVCIDKLGFKLSIEKCQFGIKQIEHLGHTITEHGNAQLENIENFLKIIKIPKTIKQVRRLIVFVQYFQRFIPNLAFQLLPFFELFRKNQDFLITKKTSR